MEYARNNLSNMTTKSGEASNVGPKNYSESFAKKENDGLSVSKVPRINPFRRGIEKTNNDLRSADVVKSDYPNGRCQ